jgi:hypothetical protein
MLKQKSDLTDGLPWVTQTDNAGQILMTNIDLLNECAKHAAGGRKTKGAAVTNGACADFGSISRRSSKKCSCGDPHLILTNTHSETVAVGN